LSVALIGSVLYLMRADGDEKPSQSVATQPMAAHPLPAPPDEKSKTAAETPADPNAVARTPSENVQATTPEQLAAEKAEPEANAEEDAEGDDKTASKRTARPRVTRSYARRPAARPDREAASDPEPTEAKPEAPAAAQRPLPKPATGGVVIENNPYMRK
jgi:cell division protein FtsN